MTSSRRAVLGAFVPCTASSMGCQRKPSDEIDSGGVEGSVYRNRYFGMTVAIPPDRSIQDRESRERLLDAGGKMLAGDDKNLRAVMKASELQSVYLLAAFRHPLGAPVPFNPSIQCIAERVRHLPGIERGGDYLCHTKTLLEGQRNVSLPKEVPSATVGGVEFDVMYAEMARGGVTVSQEYYAAVMRGYALNMILSFTTEEESVSLESILASVVFERN